MRRCHYCRRPAMYFYRGRDRNRRGEYYRQLYACFWCALASSHPWRRFWTPEEAKAASA
jgi:hypothetical protein